MYYLEANHIVKQYASHRALDNVTVHVPENGIYGLLGPNGAGKTTLIRIINQITAPDEGEVLIKGRPLHPSDVEHIGYLPEERGLYKKMKVGEQILYLAQLKGLSKNAAKEGMKYWLNKFDIKGWEKKKIEELSKGMQQKIQFITTVMHNPKLLIFDEPFSGFDPVNANLLISQFCASQDDYKNINLNQLKKLIRENKEGLFSYDVATETVTMEVTVDGGAEGETGTEQGQAIETTVCPRKRGSNRPQNTI